MSSRPSPSPLTRTLALAICLAAFAGGAVLVSPDVAMAQQAPIGKVIQYKGSTLRLYTQEGRPSDRGIVSVSELPPLPAVVVSARPGGLIGIQKPDCVTDCVVFVRGIDLEFRLDQTGPQPICTEIAPQTRASGAVVPGSNAGAGSSRDCR